VNVEAGGGFVAYPLDTSMYDEESTERHFESLRTLLGSTLAAR